MQLYNRRAELAKRKAAAVQKSCGYSPSFQLAIFLYFLVLQVCAQTWNESPVAEAYICNEKLQPVDEEQRRTPLTLGAEIRICVQPTVKTRSNRVVMRSINRFAFSKGDRGRNGVQDVIKTRLPVYPTTTTLTCQPQATLCTFKTKLSDDFFYPAWIEGETALLPATTVIQGSGSVTMEYLASDGMRQLLRGSVELRSDRSLQASAGTLAGTDNVEINDIPVKEQVRGATATAAKVQEEINELPAWVKLAIAVGAFFTVLILGCCCCMGCWMAGYKASDIFNRPKKKISTHANARDGSTKSRNSSAPSLSARGSGKDCRDTSEARSKTSNSGKGQKVKKQKKNRRKSQQAESSTRRSSSGTIPDTDSIHSNDFNFSSSDMEDLAALAEAESESEELKGVPRRDESFASFAEDDDSSTSISLEGESKDDDQPRENPQRISIMPSLRRQPSSTGAVGKQKPQKHPPRNPTGLPPPTKSFLWPLRTDSKAPPQKYPPLTQSSAATFPRKQQPRRKSDPLSSASCHGPSTTSIGIAPTRQPWNRQARQQYPRRGSDPLGSQSYHGSRPQNNARLRPNGFAHDDLSLPGTSQMIGPGRPQHAVRRGSDPLGSQSCHGHTSDPRDGSIVVHGHHFGPPQKQPPRRTSDPLGSQSYHGYSNSTNSGRIFAPNNTGGRQTPSFGNEPLTSQSYHGGAPTNQFSSQPMMHRQHSLTDGVAPTDAMSGVPPSNAAPSSGTKKKMPTVPVKKTPLVKHAPINKKKTPTVLKKKVKAAAPKKKKAATTTDATEAVLIKEKASTKKKADKAATEDAVTPVKTKKKKKKKDTASEQ